MIRMHIGLIGGIGPAATEFYYRHLTRAHARADRALELTIVHAQVRDLARHFANGARHEQAAKFAALTRRLQAAGADLVAITSVGGHFCIQEFESMSPLPVVSIIPAVRLALDRLGVRRIGLLGTGVAMRSRFYGGLPAVETLIPEGEDLAAVDREYVAMALSAEATDRQRELFFHAGRELQARGAETVLLGGTDLFLAFEGHDCGFPTLDCGLAHVEALTARSLA
jgi:aspartate racemase